MHINFVLTLFPSSSSSSSSSSFSQHYSICRCLKSIILYSRRCLGRLCFGFIVCVWSISFTTTVPLLYTIDSNEKTPRPVYCPGTTQTSYLKEWFDRNRFIQTILFNLVPLAMNLFLSLIALSKILYDCLVYLCKRLKMSKCSPCRGNSSSYQRQIPQSISNSVLLLPSLDIIGRSYRESDINLTPIFDVARSTNEITVSSSNLTIQSYTSCLSTLFLRLLLVLSSSLLICIYPVAMRFYLIYFSVLVPLIFAVINYSFAHLTLTQESTDDENYTSSVTVPLALASTDTNDFSYVNMNRVFRTRAPIKHERDDASNEQFELKSPLIANVLNEPDQSLATLTNSTILSDYCHRSIIKKKRKCFSNRLYENIQNILIE